MSKDVFAAIADANRRRIIELLATGAMTVSALASNFPVTRPAISKHLRVLSQAGLVSEQKIGRERYYRLHAEPLKIVHDWAAHYEKFWQGKLGKLGSLLGESHET